MRLGTDRWRHQRDNRLRNDDARGDQDRRPLARPCRHNAGHQRQHRSVGELQQQYAAGEDQQRPLTHQIQNTRRSGVGCLARDRAVRPSNIDFGLANPGQRKQRRYRKDESHEKHAAAGEKIAAGAHHRGRDAVAE